jgi:AcrR family transcriptional regulator
MSPPTSRTVGQGLERQTRKRASVPRNEPATQQPAAAPRSRKGAATRARLLESAKAVFEETGFLEARISDIADRAGLSHGSFYHYFDSKEQIFREVAEAQEALLTAPGDDDGDEAGAEPPSEYERIRRANRRYLERYRDNGRIMGVIEEVSRYDTFVNEARMRRQKHFADRAERAIRRLQADGAADPEVDPEIAALALGSMMGRFAELWLIEDWGKFDFDNAVEQMTRLWANAIGLREPATKARRSG